MVEHVDESVYLPSLVQGALVGDDACVLRGHHFTGCTIYGPAVIRFLDDVVVSTCTLAGEVDELVLVDDRSVLLGVIGIERCTFEFCRFTGIALSCPSDEYDEAREALSQWIT